MGQALRRGRGATGRDDRGAAALEFALILPILMLLVFGIISFGMMLTFRQTLSQAATEGARAAAVETNPGDQQDEAMAAVNEAMEAVGKTCGSGGLTCTVSDPAICGGGRCITVTLTYAYAANPMVPSAPLMEESGLIPNTLEYTATVRIA